MAKLYRSTFQGKGHFPIDMLRYDACWPSSPDDVYQLLVGHSQFSNPGFLDTERKVTVSSHRRPTDGRWRSFGWVRLITETRTV